MGISTREVGVTKFPQRGYGEGGYQNSRGRLRIGRHFHRTSLLIKAFNHKFRLDLELNTQLLAPNLIQKDFLINGAEQSSKQEIEHCYYHGTVRDYPGATAAFHTCNGVSGVIHLGNETFVIHPFYGGDLSQKHPHVIFEARTKTDKGCANSGNTETYYTNSRKKNRRQKHVLWLSESTSDRYKRDVREVTKYIETAIIIDKAMFDKRNGSTRAEVVHDAIQVANIADLYFRTLNTRVSVIYIETWQGGNQAEINKDMDIGAAMVKFHDYMFRTIYNIGQDTTQLLTGETFLGGESGMAAPQTVCSKKSIGISVDLNTYEPHLLAGTMAHMIGHNIGMAHDDGRSDCSCHDWHGCIMAQSIVGLQNVQPYKFSECSKSDYIQTLKSGRGQCLLNKPNELENRRSCGNRVIDDGEQCDCGSHEECHEFDPCCDPITCKLTSEAECASGPCCNNCKLILLSKKIQTNKQLRARGIICRESTNECDLPEVCSGETGQCPTDVYKKNGSPCSDNSDHCFNGICPALNLQCKQVWGYSSVASDKQCFEQFNSKGSINGHCGTDASGHFIKCNSENIRCGSLQCQDGYKQPIIEGMDELFTITKITMKGQEHQCKVTTGKVEGSDMPSWGLVRDGTSCGDNLICVNQTCISLFLHLSQDKCPSNHNNNECSGNGVCTNTNKCYCNPGWSGTDCSIQQDIPTLGPAIPATEPSDVGSSTPNMGKKETPYGEKNKNLSTTSMVLILVGVVKGVFISFALMAVCYRYSSKLLPKNYHGSNTVFLVGMLMSVVGGVFIVFALMALCYRSVVVHKNFSLCLRRKSTVQKYDQPYSKKPPQKNYTSGVSSNHHPEEAALDNVNKILTYGVFPHYREHKPQMKRRDVDEEEGGTGEEEVVSFIDVSPNNLTKLPEKGILKKHGYGIVMPDNCRGGISEVQQTLNQLNGYHENILEVLRNAGIRRDPSETASGSGNLLDSEAIRKSLADCGYPESYCKDTDEHDHMDNIDNQDDEDVDVALQPCSTIRIRTLEDIIKQLERHSVRHMSPSGSEEIRMSESEGDRHYRLDSSVCSESSQG
ncbi:hypothetical protein M0802_008948 [Mischocyttarus mexicanus]|nr:hypothetical protein M0802_008948 [Mischocyttarus mexicanus]